MRRLRYLAEDVWLVCVYARRDYQQGRRTGFKRCCCLYFVIVESLAAIYCHSKTYLGHIRTAEAYRTCLMSTRMGLRRHTGAASWGYVACPLCVRLKRRLVLCGHCYVQQPTTTLQYYPSLDAYFCAVCASKLHVTSIDPRLRVSEGL